MMPLGDQKWPKRYENDFVNFLKIDIGKEIESVSSLLHSPSRFFVKLLVNPKMDPANHDHKVI